MQHSVLQNKYQKYESLHSIEIRNALGLMTHYQLNFPQPDRSYHEFEEIMYIIYRSEYL